MMNSCPTFVLRGDPTESLFPEFARAESTLGIRRHAGLTWVSDGHTSQVCELANTLLERAADCISYEGTILSPILHGLDADESGCPPTILLVQPLGAAMIVPLAHGHELLLTRNPEPLLRVTK